MKVRTRFAPSPTGYLHLGGARTALFCWLFARKHSGSFVLRVEDTDRERSTDESVQAILDGMDWLGLDYDEGPFFQTKRYDRYGELIDQLIDSGHAYRCYCSREKLDSMRQLALDEKRKPRYDGTCRNLKEPVAGVEPVIRFKTPLEGKVVIEDLVKGTIEIDNAELDDLIIRRSDGNPTYNLSVVADDIDMEITHVIRGDDHINNTPRQIHIFNSLGAALPKFAHLPMILGDDSKRMSKRHGAVSVMQYQEEGFLPRAMLNYLARLGWSHGDQEIFTLDEMLNLFAIEDCQRSGSVFDKTKLLWVNQQHMASLADNELGEQLALALEARDLQLASGPDTTLLVPVLKERAQTITEMADQAEMFFGDEVSLDEKAAKKQLRPVALPVLEAIADRLKSASDWQSDNVKKELEALAAEMDIGFGKIGQPLRVAVTGSGASPDIGDTLALIGKDRSLTRIASAIAYVKARAAAG